MTLRPTLAEVLGATLHQDWREDFPSADDAVWPYVVTLTDEEKRDVVGEIDALLRDHPAEVDFALRVERGFGACLYAWDVDMPLREWFGGALRAMFRS